MILEKEREKYAKAWSLSDYRKVSPGEKYAGIFDSIAEPGQRVIDLGCGAGAGGKALKKLGHNVTYCDIENWNNLKPFVRSSLWALPLGRVWDWGYCCDVMEHLPCEMVGLAVDRISSIAPRCFFSIGLTEDHFGKVIGEPLHLTVRPYLWWRDYLKEFATVEDARDCHHTGIYIVRF